MTGRTLACMMPPEYVNLVHEALTAGGWDVIAFDRGDPREVGWNGRDPYRLQDLAESVKATADGILAILPRKFTPARACPAPVMNGVPVGIVFSDRPEDLKPWLDSMRGGTPGSPAWAIMAMARDSYISLGEQFAGWLGQMNPTATEKWFSDSVSRYDVCRLLAKGPRLVIYLGHGRPRGLDAYLGLRWQHVAQVRKARPCGVFICFACDTLNQTRRGIPFGRKWVERGRACSYFGSIADVPVRGSTLLALEVGDIFAQRTAENLGKLLQELDRRVRQKRALDEARTVLSTYRVLGNPLQPFFNLEPAESTQAIQLVRDSCAKEADTIELG